MEKNAKTQFSKQNFTKVIKTFNAGIPLSADWLNLEIVQSI